MFHKKSNKLATIWICLFLFVVPPSIRVAWVLRGGKLFDYSSNARIQNWEYDRVQLPNFDGSVRHVYQIIVPHPSIQHTYELLGDGAWPDEPIIKALFGWHEIVTI